MTTPKLTTPFTPEEIVRIRDNLYIYVDYEEISRLLVTLAQRAKEHEQSMDTAVKLMSANTRLTAQVAEIRDYVPGISFHLHKKKCPLCLMNECVSEMGERPMCGYCTMVFNLAEQVQALEGERDALKAELAEWKSVPKERTILITTDPPERQEG